jgi:hypothetical protein
MKLTDEERRAKHNAYQREYQRKLYQNNPEHAEKRKKQILENYALITPEQKARRNEYAKLYYQRKKESKIPKETTF